MQTHADIWTHLSSQKYEMTLQNSSLCVSGVHIVANDITKPIAHTVHVVVHVHIVTKNRAASVRLSAHALGGVEQAAVALQQ
jgi:hypothetical protein